MEHKAPEVGTYKVLLTSLEQMNGKTMPVATVIFKSDSTEGWSIETSTIRVRALYFPNSNGPKKEYPLDRLTYCELHIKALHITPDPNNSMKVQYSIDWDITKPDNYDQLHLEGQELEKDLDDLHFDEPDPELDAIAVDFMIQEGHILTGAEDPELINIGIDFMIENGDISIDDPLHSEDEEAI